MSARTAASHKSAVEMEGWLRQNVVVQYWKGECENPPISICRFSNIAMDWFVLEFYNNGDRML